ncbi:protein RALF-like 19 [Phalaenopsis equestris]|uniref:protein RALF-like 19 n=1 Tax=Phalaenopsis equestris TaxID=78828 RepID=UPI0009E1B4BC|nr:protein RALF-like 19 [Phalaenopsis equestris]
MPPLHPSILLLLLATASLLDPATAGTIHIHSAAPFTTGDDENGLAASRNNFYDESDEFAVDANNGRRSLMAGHRRFLSYEMLRRNRVPCTRRGVSYYNCYRHGRANPYRRGCSYITRCARDLR